MIPKIIHYIWLGNNKKPKSLEQALLSWKSHANDFEIKEWRDDNILEFNLPEYFYKLMKAKKFAFASDILRFHVLKNYGGVYFDVDQILIAGIGDLLKNKMFIAKYHQVNDYYGFGLVGIMPNHLFSNKMCEYYKDYKLDNFTIVNKAGSKIINNILEKNKNEYIEEKESNIITLLEQEYFYPLTQNDYTENTRSYHLSNTSWIPWYRKLLYKFPFYMEIKKVVKLFLPKFIKNKIFKTDYL